MCQLIALNNGFSLAEYSENSIEATIKKYRYLTRHLSRQTSFEDNTDDCLKMLHLLSKHEIRAHNKKSKKQMSNLSEADAESLLIKSFFVWLLSYHE